MDNLQRVLIIEPQNVGGNWHYAHALSRALIEAGLEVVLATLYPFEDQVGGGVRVWSIGTETPDASWPLSSLLQRVINHVDKLKRLRQIMEEFQPAIVHLHDPLGKLDFLYVKYLKAFGARVVYTAYQPIPMTGKIGWFDWARYREVDAILVHSVNGVKDLIAGGINESKITQVPHGNFLHFCQGPDLPPDQAKRLLGLPSGARTILFFGAIAPYKGLDTLIEAFSQLSTEDADLYLMICSEPRKDFTPFQQQIGKFALTGRVILDLRYIPFVEFSRYFLAADVVALPYRHIYQSGVLQLAYGFGRPVVVTDVGGLAEAVREDHTGVIATVPDARGLASAIRQVLSDPAAAALMGSRGRRLAETKYSWQTIAQKMAEVYRSVYTTFSSETGQSEEAFLR